MCVHGLVCVSITRIGGHNRNSGGRSDRTGFFSPKLLSYTHRPKYSWKPNLGSGICILLLLPFYGYSWRVYIDRRIATQAKYAKN